MILHPIYELNYFHKPCMNIFVAIDMPYNLFVVPCVFWLDMERSRYSNY